ncbi:hypothetical protein J6590_035974 [Homalodisca vitripennis]|nr:hypothetical protein J6590_035974 [Homalodisca vitripennis]
MLEPPPVEIHEEGFWALILVVASFKKGKSPLYQPLKLKQARPYVKGSNSPQHLGSPTNSNRHIPQYTKSTALHLHPNTLNFADSDVPLLDIPKIAQI